MQLFVNQIFGIDMRTQQYSLDGYLRMWWNDHRLRYNGTADGGRTDKVVLNHNVGGADIPQPLWHPDIYFPWTVENDIGEENLESSRHTRRAKVSEQVYKQMLSFGAIVRIKTAHEMSPKIGM